MHASETSAKNDLFKVDTNPKRNGPSSVTCFSNPLIISKWCSVSSEANVVLIQVHVLHFFYWRPEDLKMEGQCTV